MTSGENMRAATKGDSSKLQGDLNFASDQRESEVNLHKVTSSPSNVNPAIINETEHDFISNYTKYYGIMSKYN